MQKITTAGLGVAAALTLPIFFHSGVAAADDYAGMTYAKAAAAAKAASQTVIIAARNGDSQQEGDCVVTRSQSAPFAGANGVHVASTVQFYLDCNASYATATKPGLSLGTPEGRAAKAAADAKAAQDAAGGSSDGS